MKPIARRVSRQKLLEELTPDRFLRETNYCHNQIYTFTAHDCPNLMQEIGRLREISFREAGGGIGEPVDIDHYDISDRPYYQLIVWDPKEEEILGGYRYFVCNEIDTAEKAREYLATTHLFEFTPKFIREYMPKTIELGRSFVQPLYQSTRLLRKGMFALDNLWDGLGALCLLYDQSLYFFGKVTMYTDYNPYGRNLILSFLEKYFPDHEQLVYPLTPLMKKEDLIETGKIFNSGSYDDDYKILSKEIRSMGLRIPPLINSYMSLSPTMKTFGTSINDEFGMTEETGILITISDIYEEKTHRHFVSYIRDMLRVRPFNLRQIRIRYPQMFMEGIRQARKLKKGQ
ncbi:MAG: GNAT family N-acetyltransferase [Bacteroidales bacterium]|nr:GNAT family N-acetyltransferase [Bacteroidales bacterium]